MKLFPGLTWEGDPSDKRIYLTFDDGPHPDITPWVLNQLAEHQARATFFCVGQNAERYPEVMKLIAAGGHRAGNHTQHHLKGWKTETDAYVADAVKCSAYVDSALFRPPYGRISPAQARQLSRKGYRIIMWSLLSCDYDASLNPAKSLSSLIRNTKPGSIVVFHDSLKAEKNLKNILPDYLAAMKNRGFNFATL